MKQLKWMFLLFTAMLVGCAQLATKVGAERPDTTPQQLAYLYGSLAQLRLDTAQMLKNKVINVATAEQVQAQADIIRQSADFTKALYFSKNADPKEVERRLTGTEEALRGAAEVLNMAATIYFTTPGRSK